MWKQSTKSYCAIIVIFAFLFMIGFSSNVSAQYYPNPPEEETSTGTLLLIAAVGVAAIATLLIIKHYKKAKEKETEEESKEDSDSTSSLSRELNSQFFAGSRIGKLENRLLDEKENIQVRFFMDVRSDNTDHQFLRRTNSHLSDQAIVAGLSLSF